jgi:hypothetical protein
MKVLEEEIQGDFYFGLIERDTYIERERERERERRGTSRAPLTLILTN